MAADQRGSGNLAARNQRKYFGSVQQQQQEVDTRLNNLESAERHVIRMVGLSSLYLNGVVMLQGVDYTPAVSPTTAFGVTNLQGIFANFWIIPVSTDRNVYFGSSDETLSTNSQRYVYLGGTDTDRQVMSQFVMIPVGTDGNIKIQPTGGDVTASMVLLGYWM